MFHRILLLDHLPDYAFACFYTVPNDDAKPYCCIFKFVAKCFIRYWCWTTFLHCLVSILCQTMMQSHKQNSQVTYSYKYYQYTAVDTHQVFLFLCSSKQNTKMLVKFQSISKHESWTENLEAVLWSWRWDKIWGGESDGREEWSLEKVAVFKLDLLRHRAVRLSWNKCNELQDCSCHDDDYDDDDDVAGDSMIGLLLLLFPSCPTSWSFKRIADHKPRSLSEIDNIFFSTFPTSKNSMLFNVINT